MTQHTPGPWEIRKAKDGSGDIAIVAPNAPADQYSRPGILGECYADIRRMGENNTAEAEANARLIAAAPELMEALKVIIDDPKSEVPSGLYIAARAAIAKAEGR